jgi:hypothetical protein
MGDGKSRVRREQEQKVGQDDVTAVPPDDCEEREHTRK